MSEIIKIKNEALEVSVSTYGAEIMSVKGDKEYMWEGDPEFWGGHAPVLFPIVGRLKDGKYTHEGKTYEMASHGFASKSEYTVREKKPDSLTLFITDTDETRKSYPFSFDFEVKFSLNGSSLKVEYNVTNKGDVPLYYSTGCHEAYSCPEGVENYELVFPTELDLKTYVPSQRGLIIDGKLVEVAKNCKVLPICESFFDDDSLCFKNMGAHSVTLRHKDGARAITVDFPGFDYFVLWHVPGAKYLCLEPWQGFPDFENGDGEFSHKEGMMKLEAKATGKSEHIITFE